MLDVRAIERDNQIVCVFVSKNGWTDRGPPQGKHSRWPRNIVLDGVQIPNGDGGEMIGGEFNLL